jgi:hypothetical protein
MDFPRLDWLRYRFGQATWNKANASNREARETARHAMITSFVAIAIPEPQRHLLRYCGHLLTSQVRPFTDLQGAIAWLRMAKTLSTLKDFSSVHQAKGFSLL